MLFMSHFYQLSASGENMKKAFSIVIILVILLSMLPMSGALAKSGGTPQIEIRNSTEGDVVITLMTSGMIKSYTWFAGTHRFTISSGYYYYYAKTPCGLKTGKFNLTNNKTLLFSCKVGKPDLFHTFER